MHIPDGFLNGPVAVSAALLSATGLAFSFWQTQRTLPPQRIPLLGVSAAFVFAAQMINFPVMGGTSGHLVGGVLIGALLGPSAAAIALACVLLLQCFLFADGGITALGANIFNMAILGGVAGTTIYNAIRRTMPGRHARFTAALFAGWFSTLLAAAACAGEVTLSGHAKAPVIFPAMLGVHMLIGIGEGLITALVLESISRTNAHLLADDTTPAGRLSAIAVWGAVIAVGIAVFLSPFACPWPDGLEHVAGKLGFESAAVQPVIPALLPDYQMPHIASPGLATAIAGTIGTLLMFAIAWIVARFMVPKPKAVPADQPAQK